MNSARGEISRDAWPEVLPYGTPDQNSPDFSKTMIRTGLAGRLPSNSARKCRSV
jgi:hypothetical protein